MTDVQQELIPGFTARLQARADQVAADRTRARQRRRIRVGLTSLGAGLAIASGAYATGLWRPDLGSNPSDAPSAVDSAPAPELLDAVGVLRRPQTAADRGAAAQYALRFPATAETAIQTRFVRTLAVGPKTVVLVPTHNEATGEQGLCLWASDLAANGSARVCATAGQVRDGRLVLSTSAPATAATEAERAQRRRDQQTPAGSSGGVMQSTRPSGAISVVGLAPDGIRRVRVGDSAPVPVTDNLFEAAPSTEPAPLRATWDD